MDQTQPNVRNGPSRGRSRSVSRSRSRSRSPPSAARAPPTAGEPRDDARPNQPSWVRVPTNAEKIAAELTLRRDTENGATVTLRELKAVCGPKAEEALMKLLEASHPDFSKIKLDDAIPIGTLAKGVGPETMPWIPSACSPGFSGDFSQLEDDRARSLCTILCAIHYTQHPEVAAGDKEYHDAFVQIQQLRTMGRKTSLDELDKKVDMAGVDNGQWMRLMMTVADKHPDVGVDTMIDLGVLAAETGSYTMPLPMLVKLLLTTPASNLFRAPAPTQGHVPNSLDQALATQRRFHQDLLQRMREREQWRRDLDRMQREGVQDAAASRQRQLAWLGY